MSKTDTLFNILKVLFAFIFSFLANIAYITPMFFYERTVPMVPIYVSFIPFFSKKIDQAYIWFRYFEPKIHKSGIVKVYFAGRWNYLVNDPEYLNQLFKHEHSLFHKSGNDQKIPNSLLAYYTGTNIISAHGKQWRVFRQALLPCFLKFEKYTIAFENANKLNLLILEQIKQNQSDLYVYASTSNDTILAVSNKKEKTVDSLETTSFNLKTSGYLKSFNVNELIQKLCLDNISTIAFGFSLRTLDNSNSPLYLNLNRIKKDIFKPIFMAFPFLDKFPLKERIKTKKHIDFFKENLLNEVKKHLVDNYQYEQETYLNAGANLVKENSKGNISKNELLDNLVILLIAGHENPQLLLTSLIYILGKYRVYQDKLRLNFMKLKELYKSDTDILDYLNKDVILTSIIYETVRLYPPIGNLVNRIAAKDCYLTSSRNKPIFIKKGTYIGYNNFGLQRRTDVWGKDANKFVPERWGCNIDEVSDQWKTRKFLAQIGAFHGGNRNCIGEEISLNIMRITMFKMITELEWKLSSDWIEKITPAGPISPFQLKIDIKQVYNKN